MLYAIERIVGAMPPLSDCGSIGLAAKAVNPANNAF
jgi:hypothetical protein